MKKTLMTSNNSPTHTHPTEKEAETERDRVHVCMHTCHAGAYKCMQKTLNPLEKEVQGLDDVSHLTLVLGNKFGS